MLRSVDHVDCIERTSPCKAVHDFGYLIEKVVSAPFSSEPFRHVYIENFFSAEHFAQIVGTEEIRPPIARDENSALIFLPASLMEASRSISTATKLARIRTFARRPSPSWSTSIRGTTPSH
jgi:hypothetical protein